MSKRKSKKSKNTMLIVFLVITFIIAIALLLYFFLWKENYGEIRENMTEGGQGKGYEKQCMDADNYRCKENLTCADINQGKGTCKCKSNETHFSELSDEQKKFFKDECISNSNLNVYNNDLGTKDGCDFISGVWDGKKCLQSGKCEEKEEFAKRTDIKICETDACGTNNNKKGEQDENWVYNGNNTMMCGEMVYWMIKNQPMLQTSKNGKKVL